MHRRITDLAYRLRPEQPPEGLEYISISSEAKYSFFSKGVPLNIAVWNTFKGRRERYYDFLSERTADADLILLQEFRHDPVLEASHRDIFKRRDAGMAVSFYTRPNQEAPTGVCTVSAARSTQTLFLLSRYLEPVTKTPKMAICTSYPIEQPDCPPEHSLLVLNSHGINFRLRKPFLDQMLQFEHIPVRSRQCDCSPGLAFLKQLQRISAPRKVIIRGRPLEIDRVSHAEPEPGRHRPAPLCCNVLAGRDVVLRHHMVDRPAELAVAG